MGKAQNSKSKFRSTSKWKKFRKRIKEERKLDEVTLRPLHKAWNLHHMNLDPLKYEDISNEDTYCALNKTTHEIIHILYKYYREDPLVLERLKYILEEMVQINENISLKEENVRK